MIPAWLVASMAAQLPSLPGYRWRDGVWRVGGWTAAGVGITRDRSSNAQYGVYSRVRLIVPFPSFLFSSFCWDGGKLAFWQVFSSFLIHPLNLSSCTDKVELFGAVLWPRGRLGAANRGRQALARDLSLALDLLAGTSTRRGAGIRSITSAFWAIEQ